MDNNILFLVKYGEEKYIKEIVEGLVRFSPSQEYINIEKNQHDKGQGDMLEGKMKIKFETARAYDPDTNELLGTIQNANAILSIQDVNNLPIHCMAYGTKGDCIDFVDENNYTIKIDDKKADTIRNDFKRATHALVILNPKRFIDNFSEVHEVVADRIKYFDFDINTLQMMNHLMGIENHISNFQYSLEYKNRHRHLMCKDIAFENQFEFRMILKDTEIVQPTKYRFDATSLEYKLIPIEEFFDGLKVIF